MPFTGRSTTGPQQHLWAGETQHCSPEGLHTEEGILQGKLPCSGNWSVSCRRGAGSAQPWVMELETLPGHGSPQCEEAGAEGSHLAQLSCSGVTWECPKHQCPAGAVPGLHQRCLSSILMVTATDTEQELSAPQSFDVPKLT